MQYLFLNILVVSINRPAVSPKLSPASPKIPVATNGLSGHLLAVRTVKEIKIAIRQLSLEERAEVVAELCGWTDDDWDRQMKTDAAAGKFASLNHKAALIPSNLVARIEA